jgi:non-ribosomal peptide synthetase component F
VHYQFPTSVQKALNELVRTQGATLFMGLVAAVKALLHQYTGQHDLVVGSPVAGREHPDLEAQVGLYVNTIALRTRMQGGESFNDLLQLVKEVTVQAYGHQAYPFDELVEALTLRRDQSRNVVFDVMVVLQQAERSVAATNTMPGGVRLLPYGSWNKGWESGVSAFDCTFTFIEAEGTLVLAIEYSSDLFNRSTIERMAEQLHLLIDHVIHHADQPLRELAGQYVLVPTQTSRRQQLINDLDL